MSEVLYRKWRPTRLDQVVGQEAVAQTLRNAVDQNRVAHAYLLCGPRGTGKTSTARILAKAVNCLAPQGGEPDNECEICLAINEGRAMDLLEIDAASNRGIDDIRNLRDRVRFAPNQARYKVYIIDEVHMLTEPAFNALLKTLEEPPQHAIFVLATTEVHKVPLTIISRCQRFDFRRIPLETAVTRLGELCREDGIEVEPGALRQIARAGAGSMRDAENLLEQALISYGSPLREDQVSELLELGTDERALELVGHILSRSVRDGLTVINAVADDGSDLRNLHRAVLDYLRAVLLTKSGVGVSLGHPEETANRLGDVAKETPVERIVAALKAFSETDMRRDGSSPLPLELALLDSTQEPQVTAPPPSPAAPAPARPQPRARAAPPIRPQARAGQPAPPPVPQPSTPSPQAATDREALPTEPSARLETQWSDILRSLSRYKGKRFNLGALLRDCKQREVSNGSLILRFSYRSHMERMEEELQNPESRKVLNDTLARALDGPVEIEVAVVDDGSGGRRQSAAQRSHLVRAAQAMGARVVGEKEVEIEQEDDETGSRAPEEHVEDAG